MAIRDKKGGRLTKDDLDEIPEVSSTLWDSFISENLICVGDPEQEPQHMIDALRSRISVMENERADGLYKFQDQMEKMRTQTQIQIDDLKQSFQQETDKYEFNQKELEREVSHFKFVVVKQEDELQQSHKQTDKLQKQLDQKESLAKIEKVISDRENKLNRTNPSKGITPSPNTYEHSKHENKNRGPVGPKLALFDGKGDWIAYLLQFTTIADRYKWSNEQRLFKLIECLREKARKVYSTRPRSVQNNYTLLCQKLNGRFGRKELPHVLRRIFQDLRQDQEGLIEEFAERVQDTAMGGSPDTPESLVEPLAIDVFLRGCLDKGVALITMYKNPETVDKALQLMRTAIANKKLTMGGKETEIKRLRVTFDDTEEK
jgi:hypothetical protein